jgi:adenosylhomocysteine nucleosidase
MLGIVVALPWELKSLTHERIPLGEWRGITENVMIALSGMGAERAYAAASVLVRHGATALMGWGCAAALEARLRAGGLILPERIIGINGKVYRPDADWHRRLYQRLSLTMPVETSPVAETDVILRSATEKRALRERTQAAASDMESAAAARLAGEVRRPFIAVRAIADTASTDLPQALFTAITSHGCVGIEKLLARALFHPSDCLKLARLAVQLNAAQKTLAASREVVLESSPLGSIPYERSRTLKPAAVFTGLHREMRDCKKKE